MRRARGVAVLLGVALCAGCSSTGAHDPTSAPATTTLGATATPTSDRPLAPVVENGGPGASPTTKAAMHAFGEIWVATPHSAYGGVLPGGGAGITVLLLPGPTHGTLARLLRQARRAGVIVQVRQARASLADLEALGDHGILRRLPEELKPHLVATRVDIQDNRVVATFDVPLDDDLRATVAHVFGDEVAVAFGRPASFAMQPTQLACAGTGSSSYEDAGGSSAASSPRPV